MQRQRSAATLQEELPRIGQSHLDHSDFHYLQDRLNSDLGGVTRLSSLDSRLTAAGEKLRVVDMSLEPALVVVPLICPSLVSQVFQSLARPYHLKLSTDGTYRLLLNTDYTLLNIGINVKHWAKAKTVAEGGHCFACRSQYVPLAFAIASSEAGPAYTHFASTFFRVCQHLVPGFSPECVLQWHGDMHLGIEAARVKTAPLSVRLSDWAHVTGATSSAPAGFAGLVTKYLPKDDFHFTLLLRWFRLSRYMPAYLFHLVWTCLFRSLGEHPIVAPLQRQYFHKTHELWDAHWRAAPDRIMPGTAVGSAPQESWHGQSLKNLVHVRGSTPYDLAVKLRSTVLAWEVEKLQTMKREGRRFEDWPQAERHLDQQVLKGDVALARQGRTSAKRIFELQQHVRWKDPADNVWFMVPSSMLAVAGTYGKKKTYQLHQPVTLPRNALQHLATLCTAESLAVASRALSELKVFDVASGSLGFGAAERIFADWRCVVMGPKVLDYWRSHCQDPEGNHHIRTLCWFCETAAKAGPCEHSYCALLHEGVLSTAPAAQPRKKGRPRKEHQARPSVPVSGSLLLPGPLLSSSPACLQQSCLRLSLGVLLFWKSCVLLGLNLSASDLCPRVPQSRFFAT